MKKLEFYTQVARTLQALKDCQNPKDDNDDCVYDWETKLDAILQKLINENLPSGSGFDAGVWLLEKETTPERLVFQADFHHINNSRWGNGWTCHKIIITPSLQFGFNVKVTGRNRNGIKDYITEVFAGQSLESR